MRRCEIYSPKIEEELIPRLYRQAKAEGRHMTEVASDAVREYLERHVCEGIELVSISPEEVRYERRAA